VPSVKSLDACLKRCGCSSVRRPLVQFPGDVFGKRTSGVILSGSGDDGTAGSRAIRAAGGVLAQDPDSSERSEMPMAAFDVGRVDVVLRPNQLCPPLRALAGRSPFAAMMQFERAVSIHRSETLPSSGST
jgi:chemotaxis response regulator CheB